MRHQHHDKLHEMQNALHHIRDMLEELYHKDQKVYHDLHESVLKTRDDIKGLLVDLGEE